MTAIAQTLDTLAERSLTREEAAGVFRGIIGGEHAELEIAAILAALKTRGETMEEIAGAAQALRDAALPFPRPDYPYADTCGTGGDGTRTVNVSTAVAVIAAELGIPVAKHGNRSVSSRCGSADLLEALGVKLDPAPAVARRCLDEVGLCFLFAPQYHSGVRHAMPARKALGTRTLFNLLGPLANPAAPAWQLVGVYAPSLCRPVAHTLGLLGCDTALVVHGSGLDEVALHGPTHAALWKDGEVREFEIVPEDAGLERRPIDALRGGGPAENAAWLESLLAGDSDGARRDAVALNAGAVAWIAGVAPGLRRGVAMAHDAIASGYAATRFSRWAELSHAA
jgi:anthranilate phosphoribosyltransferase